MGSKSKVLGSASILISFSLFAIFVLSGSVSATNNTNTTSPSPTASSDYCIDDDGGKNYFVRGVVRGKTGGIYYDGTPEICLNATTLEEKYCGGKEQYKCPNECKDGACLSPLFGGACTDSSDCETGFACFNGRCEMFACPQMVFVCDPNCPTSGYLNDGTKCYKGVNDPHGCFCIDANKTSTQSPKPSPSPLAVCTEDTKECPDGFFVSRIPPSCSFVPCPNATSDYCTDDDGGKNYFVRGVVRGKTGGIYYDGTPEICLNSTTLEEKYCGGKEQYKCSNGCKDGACLSPLIGGACTDSSKCEVGFACFNGVCEMFACPAVAFVCDPNCPASGYLSNGVLCDKGIKDPHGCGCIDANKTSVQSPLPKLCPDVCVPMWEIRNNVCVFNSCGSGCGEDNVTTFKTELDCKAKMEVISSDTLSDSEINSLLDISVRLEVLKTKFDAISRLAKEIADYWQSVGEMEDSNKWRQISVEFVNVKNSIESTRQFIRQVSSSPTKADSATIKAGIRNISERVKGILLSL